MAPLASDRVIRRNLKRFLLLRRQRRRVDCARACANWTVGVLLCSAMQVSIFACLACINDQRQAAASRGLQRLRRATGAAPLGKNPVRFRDRVSLKGRLRHLVLGARQLGLSTRWRHVSKPVQSAGATPSQHRGRLNSLKRLREPRLSVSKQREGRTVGVMTIYARSLAAATALRRSREAACTDAPPPFRTAPGASRTAA